MPLSLARRRRLGRSMLAVLALLAIVAVSGAITAAVLLIVGPDKQSPQPPPPPTQQEIEDRLAGLQQQFQSAMQEGLDLDRVLSQTRLFTIDHPQDPSGHMLLAQVRMRNNQWDDAYNSWTRALELGVDEFEVHKMTGFCAARLGRLKQAESHYKKSVQVSGDRADNEVFASLGRLYLAMNQPDAAEAAYQRSLNAPGAGDKTNWRHGGYSGLADVAAMRGEPDKAVGLIDRALKLAKLDSKADVVGYHIQKARVYLDAGRPGDATALLNSTARLGSDAALRIEAARLRARLYKQSGDLDKAVNHIASVCQLYQLEPDREDPKLADYYALLAQWQIKAGQKDLARTSIANLKTLLPKHPRLPELEAAMSIAP